MMWQRAELLVKQTDKIDVLGNTIDSFVVDKVIKVRLTQFTLDELSVFGRDINANSRKLVTPYKGCIDFVRIKGITYKATKIEDLGRFTLAIIEGV